MRASKNTVIGSPAGRKHVTGYWEVRLDKVLYKTSRVVYKLYNNGEDPGLYEVDHLDRNKDHNAGSNLFLDMKPGQQSNREVKSRSGYRNVTFDKRERRKLAPWIAQVCRRVDGERISQFLGYHANPYIGAVAAVAYKREIGMRYEYAPGGTK